MNLENPVMVALDVDNLKEAVGLAKTLQGRVGAFKVGPRLSLKYGQKIIEEVLPYGPVFLDQKFYDIPNTMEQSVRMAFEVGASYATIHALSGKTAARRLALLEKELNAIRPFKILVVTLLTSFELQDWPAAIVSEGSGSGASEKVNQFILELASLVDECGLSGIVCSPLEAKFIRQAYPGFFIVTPGIRPQNQKAINDDQKRVATPREALNNGASALVIGRPILEAKNPLAEVESIIASLS